MYTFAATAVAAAIPGCDAFVIVQTSLESWKIILPLFSPPLPFFSPLLPLSPQRSPPRWPATFGNWLTNATHECTAEKRYAVNWLQNVQSKFFVWSLCLGNRAIYIQGNIFKGRLKGLINRIQCLMIGSLLASHLFSLSSPLPLSLPLPLPFHLSFSVLGPTYVFHTTRLQSYI